MYVEGRATEDPYYRRTTKQREHELLQMRDDYCEIRTTRKDKTDKQRSFVARDTWTQAIYATIVDAKSNGDVDNATRMKHCIATLCS